MAFLKIIEFLPVKKSNNSVYTGFMSLICALILKVTPEVLGLADLIVVFQKLLAQMQEIVKRSTRAEETPEMQSLDQKRDSLFTYVSTAIANAEKSPVAAQKNAYQVLMIDFLPYYKIGLAYDKNISETAQLTGFVHDMSKTTNLAQIKILGLDAALNELDTTNKAYEALMTSRLSSVTQDDLGPSKDIRFKMDDVYDMMKDVVNAKNILEPSAVINACIVEWNKAINDMNASIKQTETMRKKSSAY